MSKSITTLTIKPKFSGLLVRMPNGERLQEEGETVPRTAYWLRRLKDGDVLEVKPATIKKETK